jgi:hypothetical protein
MGLGKHRDDGTGPILGTLHKRPWENEPLTEIQPITEVETQLDCDGRENAKIDHLPSSK